ncbi:30S ribosomal protein S8 [Candidatus Saccharibacteria bacterium]|nr:30S ribosomal protein S8 [Candidatus Saccharibacteria bacterium]NIV03720.1 30S ribosomal protein S8 [Calditrichia bacterium]NIV72021.1 30S ribosomal protein S8 [Calditrichia bacterium]NIV98854.1 30S ribosomal protein S8 [Candidatus Saccharibacteria bacterium]NIW79131.1 30S ribosomal protein S8 [Calditrichia bacterium]
MTDPIADYLTRIRNAIQANHRTVDIPASNVKKTMTQILYDNKFIRNYIIIDDGKQGLIRIFLKYVPASERFAIHELRRVSKPGRRHYVDVHNLPRVKNNMGIAILSTSKGVMTEREARRERVGGEVMCYIW